MRKWKSIVISSMSAVVLASCSTTTFKHVHLEDIMIANQLIKDVVVHTPLQRNDVLSERYECNIYLKREDLQVVRRPPGRYVYISSETAIV